MTYPRNAASPEPIAIGAVVQVSDGAVQTSGCTVRIKPIGVDEGDGGGATAYSTDGVVLYTPTQAETNYTSFVLIAKKTGCIPVAVTVVTSASATAGYVGTDQGKIANATSTVNLSGTTIKAVTDAVTAGTVSDKSGYSLSVSGIAAIWDALTSGLSAVNSIGKLLVDKLTSVAQVGSAMTLADDAIAEAKFADDTAKYQAKIWFLDDTAEDRYAVVWFKNGEPIVAGITSPTIWVYDTSGADLLGTSGSPQALTQIGATGTYMHDEGTNRVVDGTLYLARVRATIDGSTRTWYQQLGRDA